MRMPGVKVTATAAALIVAGASLAFGLRAALTGEASQDHLTPEELVDVALPKADAAQAEILADGVITLEEWNGAVANVARCVEDAGLTAIIEPGRGVGGSDQLLVQGHPSVMSSDEATRVHTACRDRYTTNLQVIWAEQNRPTADEVVDQGNGFDECVIANGQPQLAGDRGEFAGHPDKLNPGSRTFWIYFGCMEHGRGWVAPPG